MTTTISKTGTPQTTAEIRAAFLDYFASKGHRVQASAPLVPEGDATLLFVNAGMVPFKEIFTGVARSEFSRAVSSQRCLRVSGKHNDLEEVGRTPRHHTLFEMLGNFSFGDYFKREAIQFAWEFLTERLKLDPNRLAFTVFGGEGAVGPDEEAEAIWQEITGCSPDRVIRFGMKDNFWQMGDTGPCGPCSEIHYDLGPDLPGTVNDGARWMEIWNLVFMQFERDAQGKLTPLPAPSIDTGMGLERIAAVVQGKRSNYETDLFASLVKHISGIAGRAYDGSAGDDAVSMRVIADHARAVACLLADGVHPDRGGRGYVLRKVLRRAVSHGVLLGISRPFLSEVTEEVVRLLGSAHPVLVERRLQIKQGVEAEEALYRRTVEQGMKRIDDLLQQLEDPTIWDTGAEGARILKGDVAFRLYDTYGCPLELTSSVGVRRSFVVDEVGFQRAMEVQKERSREHWKGTGAAKSTAEPFFVERRGAAGVTRFTGYETLEGTSDVRVLALVQESGLVAVDRAVEGQTVALVTSGTPFYGESGGQVGDAGDFTSSGAKIRIEDVQRLAGGEIFVHFGTVEEGEIARGVQVSQRVDAKRRQWIAAHHSATHLAHHALRELLGAHVQQKGSYVGPDRLRFDFSHTQAVNPAELEAIETRVNELIRANVSVEIQQLPIAKARDAGALMFFGDKYGEMVRVVTMGPSKELCGGTHASATGNLGYFTFASEGSVASGVRRVEAFAAGAAVDHARRIRGRLVELAGALRTSPEESLGKIADLNAELTRLRKRIDDLERVAAKDAAGALAERAVTVGDCRLITGRVPTDSRDALRDLADTLRASGPRTVVVLAAEIEEKVALVAAVSDDLAKAGKIKAGDLVGKVAALVGGGGGGKPHLATAGGKDVAALDPALESVPSIVAGFFG